MDSDCEITRALLLVARRCIPVTSSNALVTSCYYIVVTYYCSCFSKVPFATAQAGRGSRCRRPRGPGGRWELSWRPYGRDAGGQRPGPKGKEDRRRTEGPKRWMLEGPAQTHVALFFTKCSACSLQPDANFFSCTPCCFPGWGKGDSWLNRARKPCTRAT